MASFLDYLPYVVATLAFTASPTWFAKQRISVLRERWEAEPRILHFVGTSHAFGQIFRVAVFNMAYGTVDVFRMLAAASREGHTYDIEAIGIVLGVFALIMALCVIALLWVFQHLPDEALIQRHAKLIVGRACVSFPALLGLGRVVVTLAPMVNRLIVEGLVG